MSLTRKEILAIAREDLADRLGVGEEEIEMISFEEEDFPNTALGALEEDEMAGEMITSGYRLIFGAEGDEYEYRADDEQIRLVNFDGSNFLIYE